MANGFLYVDNDLNPASGQSQGTSVGLSTSAATYIGGAPTGVTIPSRAGITGGEYTREGSYWGHWLQPASVWGYSG